MSDGHSQRTLSDVDTATLLEAIGACRKMCITTQMKAPFSGPIYDGCDTLTRGIDDLAGVLTGDHTYFWLKIPGRPLPGPE
jgi:hypothetical protein